MALVHHTGDIFSTKMPAIAHGCNIDGLMGAGIAESIRNIYPDIYPPYKVACATKIFVPGSMLPVKTHSGMWVFNLASQDRPGPHARLEWLRESLEAMMSFMADEGIKGVALPRIGAGIGGLGWDEVLQVFEDVSAANPSITVEVWTFQ